MPNRFGFLHLGIHRSQTYIPNNKIKKTTPFRREQHKKKKNTKLLSTRTNTQNLSSSLPEIARARLYYKQNNLANGGEWKTKTQH